jgi:hypothetical protein
VTKLVGKSETENGLVLSKGPALRLRLRLRLIARMRLDFFSHPIPMFRLMAGPIFGALGALGTLGTLRTLYAFEIFAHFSFLASTSPPVLNR